MATKKHSGRAAKKTGPKKRVVKRTRKAKSKLADVARSIGTTLGKMTVKTREITEKTREAIRGSGGSGTGGA